MPRKAEPEAKTLRLVLIPKPGWESAIREFKRNVREEKGEISVILYEKVLEHLAEREKFEARRRSAK